MPPLLTRFLRRLRSLSAPPSGETDAVLLARFARRRDEDAFAALVARHGPMVRNACIRVLGDFHAAEDCFQATFLILARRANSLRRPDALAGWLYGVASRVARDAQRLNARRPRHNLDGLAEPADPRPDPLAALSACDVLLALEEELRRMPQAYRLPLVLCCLEGLAQEEAARRLGWTAGAVKGRLERGRKQLHRRLARRGLTLGVALGVAEAARGTASAAVPVSLILSTADAATRFAAGTAAAGVATSTRAAALANGGLKAMIAAKMKIAAALLLAVGMIGSGAGALTYRCFGAERAGAAQDGPPPSPAQTGKTDDDQAIRELKEANLRLAEKLKLLELQAEADKEQQTRLQRELEQANEQLKKQAARLEEQAALLREQAAAAETKLAASEAARRDLEELVSRLKKDLDDALKKLKDARPSKP